MISDGTQVKRNQDGTLKDGFVWGDDVAVLTARHNVQFQFYKKYTAHEEYAALRKEFPDVIWPEVDLPAPTWDGVDRMLVESRDGRDDGTQYRVLEDYSAFQSFPQSTYVFRW